MSRYTAEEREAIMREARQTQDRFRDWEPSIDPANVVFIRSARKPEPEPETRRPLDTPVQQMIEQSVGQVRAAMAEQREEILEWCRGVLAELIASADNDLAKQAKALRAEFGKLRTKTLESDVNTLQAENVALRADVEGLKQMVDQLVAQVLELAGDLAAANIDRSGGRLAVIRGGAT